MPAGVLIALGIATAVIIVALVGYMLTSPRFRQLRPDRVSLTVLLLFFVTLAAVMSFLLFNALAYGDAYGIGSRNTGKVYRSSRDPVAFWLLATIYYGLAVLAVSCSFFAAVRFLQPRPSPSAVGLRDDGPSGPFERLAAGAGIVYVTGIWIALYVYWSRDWALPPRYRLAAVLSAPVFALFGVLGMYTGAVGLKVRKTAPVAHWTRVALLLALGIGLFLFGIGALGA